MCSDASNAVGMWALTVNMLFGGLCVIWCHQLKHNIAMLLEVLHMHVSFCYHNWLTLRGDAYARMMLCQMRRCQYCPHVEDNASIQQNVLIKQVLADLYCSLGNQPVQQVPQARSNHSLGVIQIPTDELRQKHKLEQQLADHVGS